MFTIIPKLESSHVIYIIGSEIKIYNACLTSPKYCRNVHSVLHCSVLCWRQIYDVLAVKLTDWGKSFNYFESTYLPHVM